ncbi:MAG TPA: DUF5985 family protein [Vicinamibacterales bacterium]|nr:DUF5985 family protein [Vicinamibacterales bacterium]
MVPPWSLLMLGAIAMGCFVAGLLFLRYWRDGRDRFFLLLGCSFFVEAFSRVLLAVSARPNEGSPWIYGIRLLAYVLILRAIWEKNRRTPGKVESSPTGPESG